MLTIWGRANSINVQKVLWCCTELDIEFERIDAGLTYGVVTTPGYMALNPNSLVPTINDDGYILWESNVIVRYLAAKHGPGSLYPDDLQTRFLCEKWMEWQTSTLWMPLRTVFQGLIRTPPEKRDEKAIAAAQAVAETNFGILDRHLAGREFLEADRLTVADIPAGATAYRWFALGNSREAYPHVARWYDGLVARPGFSKYVMLPLT